MARTRRGGIAGFVMGVVFGGALSAATLAALSLSAPPVAPTARDAGPIAQPQALDPSPAAPAAPEAAVRPPEPAVAPPPAWLRNAAPFDAAAGEAFVAVAVVGLEAAPALQSALLADGPPLSLVVEPATPGALALGARARAAGWEVFLLGAGNTPWAVGRAGRGLDAAALAAATGAGLAALDLDPGATAPAGLGARADFAPGPEASAEQVFQTLDEAARRAREGGPAVVALPATEPALRALARWRAAPAARLGPVTAAAARIAGTDG